MSSKSLVTLLILITLATSISGCGSKLPDAYGIYAKEGRSLTEFEMEGNRPAEKWYNFDDDVEILVHHPSVKGIGTGRTLSATIEGVPPLALLTYVRAKAEYETKADQSVQFTNVEPEKSEAALKRVSVRYIPVEDKPEMLILSPRKPLERGFYAFGEMDENPIRFAVDVDDDPDEIHKYRGCVDLHVTRRNYRFRSELKPCEILDEKNKEWRAEAIQALIDAAESGDLDDPYAKAKKSLSINPEDQELRDLFRNTFAKGVRAAIEAGHFKTAATRANRILEVIPNDEEATRLLAEVESMQ